MTMCYALTLHAIPFLLRFLCALFYFPLPKCDLRHELGLLLQAGVRLGHDCNEKVEEYDLDTEHEDLKEDENLVE